MIKGFVHRLGRWYVTLVCRNEYESQRTRGMNERPIEYAFLLKHLAHACPETVLDVGTGTTALPHLLQNCGFRVTAIDNVKDYWKGGVFFNRHFYIKDQNILEPSLNERFDFVACISVLEHIPAHRVAVASMLSLLSPGGHLAITVPYNEREYIENVYQTPGAGYGGDLPFPAQVYSRAELDAWVEESGAELVAQEYWRVFTGKFWTYGERLRPPIQVERHDEHQLSCLLFRKPKQP